jgi:endogenous inhibitor of DNA gyrase (YacG/DUF329 family)
MRTNTPVGGGRREISVNCPDCGHVSTLPPSAIVRNQFFCSGCGTKIDLSGIFRQIAAGEGANLGARRDRDSRYKSARKARR